MPSALEVPVQRQAAQLQCRPAPEGKPDSPVGVAGPLGVEVVGPLGVVVGVVGVLPVAGPLGVLDGVDGVDGVVGPLGPPPLGPPGVVGVKKLFRPAASSSASLTVPGCMVLRD